MDLREVSEFLQRHPEKPVSPAKLEYTFYMFPEGEQNALEKIAETAQRDENEMKTKEEIESTEDPSELLRMMRRQYSRFNMAALRRHVLKHEKEMYPLIQKRCITNGMDIFTENALNFFLNCEENPAEWIYAEYPNFRNEYLKSMFCLVLGARGTVEMIPFLMKETERFEKLYYDESFEQGPILAIQKLSLEYL